MRISDWSSDVCSSDLRARGSDRRDRGGLDRRAVVAGDLALVEQRLDLLAAQRLIFQHGVGEQVKLVLMTLQYFLRPRIALLDQPANFLVDQLRRLVRHLYALALSRTGVV